MHETFVGDVIDVHKVGLPLGRKVCVVNSIPVVLRSDVNLVCKHVLDWLVVATISELELISLASSSTSKELVSQADAEDGNVLLQRPPQVGNGLLAHGGVAGAVGDEQPVEPLLLDVPVPGNDSHAHSGSAERSDDVVLDAAVDRQDVHVAGAKGHGNLGGDVSNEVEHVGIAERDIFLHHDLSLHAPVHAQLLGERTGVNSVHTRYVVLLEPLR
mmetsp:Transcript_34549/g.108294  ORF Transcript_34549/g.108294 Transcript_34549/m.108294 type:complete len:215 (+) Transcript_34549:3498-4142(+)